jgi:hypothetical protein
MPGELPPVPLSTPDQAADPGEDVRAVAVAAAQDVLPPIAARTVNRVLPVAGNAVSGAQGTGSAVTFGYVLTCSSCSL